jgi:hypothetical protein
MPSAARGGEEYIRSGENGAILSGIAKPRRNLDPPARAFGLIERRAQVAVHVRGPVQVHALEYSIADKSLHEGPVYGLRARPEETAQASGAVGGREGLRIGVVADSPGRKTVGDEEAFERRRETEHLEVPVPEPKLGVEGSVVVHRHEHDAIGTEGFEHFGRIAMLPHDDQVPPAPRQSRPDLAVGYHLHLSKGSAEQVYEEVGRLGLCEVEGVREEGYVHEDGSK